jgi:hypothetical protein
MTANTELERRLSAYYSREVPVRAPDRVLHAALAAIDITQQRRAFSLVPRRLQATNFYARAAIAAVAVVLVGAGVLAVIGPGRGSGPGGVANPAPSSLVPSPSVSPRPSPSPLPALTGSFTSTVFGVSSAYPAGWKVQRATQLRTPTGSCQELCADRLYEKETDSPFYDLESRPRAGQDGAAWMASVISDPGYQGTCAAVTEPIVIDGTAGTLATICPTGLFVAVTTTGGRGYVFVLYRVSDINEFKEFLATVRLQPEDAKDVMPSSSPS